MPNSTVRIEYRLANYGFRNSLDLKHHSLQQAEELYNTVKRFVPHLRLWKIVYKGDKLVSEKIIRSQ